MVYNAIGTRENIKIIDSANFGGVKIEVMEYQKLMGSTDSKAAMDLYYMEKQNIRVRQVAVYINNDAISVQPGAMSYFQGPLEMISGMTPGNAIGRLFSGAVTGEGAAQPEYKGSGMLVLEPSFQHFLLLQLDHEEIIVDKGMFYCAQTGVAVKPIMQRNISSALAGGEGLFQISLSGTGLVVLECPVPSCEIDVIELQKDTLRVDGNFAVLRSASLEFTVERSAKTLLGSAVSGEGLVNVYRGTGSVWLAPTIKVYNTISAARTMGGSTKLMNMNTSNSR